MARSFSAKAAFFAALAIVALLMAARVQFGLEWYGDEANAMAEPMRYTMGDLPISDSWHTQFSSGILLTPLMWLLLKVTETGSGLVIGFRLAFVVMQIGVAYIVWRILRRVISDRAAGALAVTVFWYAPYFYVFPYYNNIAVAALLVSTLATYAAFSGDGAAERRLLVLAGLAFAVAVIVYPTMLGMVPFTVAGVLGYARARRWSLASLRSSIMWLLGVAIGALLLYAAIVLAIASRGELMASLPYFLHPIDRDMSLSALVARFLRTKAVIGASVASLVVLGIGLALGRWTRLSREVAAAAAVAVACLFAVIAPYLPHTLLYYMDVQQSAMLGIALVVPVLLFVWRDERVDAVFWLLTVPAVGAAACTALVSYEGFETATMPMVIGAVATLIVLYQKTAGPGTDTRRRLASRAPVVANAAVILLLMGTTLLLTGGDDVVWRLDSTIGSGPYSSVRTTASGAERHDRYMELLTPLAREGGRIAFVEEFPVGYLLTGSRPGTYSIWTTFATGDLWQPYVDITGNYPSTIVATRFAGPNGGTVERPFEPPFGLDEFDRRYSETYRDDEFVIYRERVGLAEPGAR